MTNLNCLSIQFSPMSFVCIRFSDHLIWDNLPNSFWFVNRTCFQSPVFDSFPLSFGLLDMLVASNVLFPAGLKDLFLDEISSLFDQLHTRLEYTMLDCYNQELAIKYPIWAHWNYSVHSNAPSYLVRSESKRVIM